MAARPPKRAALLQGVGGKERGYAIGTLYQIGDEIRRELPSLTTSAIVASVPVHTSKGSVPPADVVAASRVELGAGWPAVPRSGIVLEVRIDDSTFTSPLVCTLTDPVEGEFVLVWRRPGRCG
jgi:uncharacterized protein (DUF736 family)